MVSLRKYNNALQRRNFLEKQLKSNLDNIAQFSFTEESVNGRNIENLIGATQIPLGVAGPIRVKESKSQRVKDYYVPLATTEGALVASISRGCKAVTQSGGATVVIENVGITRGPVFKTKGLSHGFEIKKWIEKNFNLIAQTAQKTSSHLKLLKIEPAILGRNIFLRFSFDSADAMGMNMASIATQEAVNLIEQKTKTKCIALAGNFDIDKKPAWLNFISGRGKKVWAEVVLPKKIVGEILKTTPQNLVEVVQAKTHLGSILSGSLGFNSHFANVIAAIFIATGQDPAHIVEGSLGITTAEVLGNGDLYFSVYLPALVVGTVGGGTHLPTQQEALKLMKVKNVLEFASVIAAVVLAGELSLLASLAEGTLAKAHQKLGRKK